MYVEFYRTETSGPKIGKQTTIGRAVLEDGEVRFEGLPRPMVEAITSDGIAGPGGPKRGLLYPKDGVEFMEALQYQYSGSYLRASEVKGSGNV